MGDLPKLVGSTGHLLSAAVSSRAQSGLTFFSLGTLAGMGLVGQSAVVYGVNQMLLGNFRSSSVQGDLWVKMAELIRGATVDFFRCSWKKGHATDEIIAAGGRKLLGKQTRTVWQLRV